MPKKKKDNELGGELDDELDESAGISEDEEDLIETGEDDDDLLEGGLDEAEDEEEEEENY
jgi:hypothetical protein